MTHAQAVVLIAYLAQAYPTVQLTEKNVETYVECILDLPEYEATQAVKVIRLRSTFFPSIAEIREETIKLSGLSVPTAGEAWDEVVRMIQLNGYDKPPVRDDFSHPEVYRALKCLGLWYDVCMGEVHTTRAHYMQIYREFLPDARKQLQTANVEQLMLESSTSQSLIGS